MRTVTICCFLVLLSACSRPPRSMASEEIVDFQSCVAAGNPVLKSYPPRCVASDGRQFVKHFDARPQVFSPSSADRGDRLCADKCGDGICQEIVCMAEGCPCAEGRQNCPTDCH